MFKKVVGKEGTTRGLFCSAVLFIIAGVSGQVSYAKCTDPEGAFKAYLAEKIEKDKDHDKTEKAKIIQSLQEMTKNQMFQLAQKDTSLGGLKVGYWGCRSHTECYSHMNDKQDIEDQLDKIEKKINEGNPFKDALITHDRMRTAFMILSFVDGGKGLGGLVSKAKSAVGQQSIGDKARECAEQETGKYIDNLIPILKRSHFDDSNVKKALEVFLPEFFKNYNDKNESFTADNRFFDKKEKAEDAWVELIRYYQKADYTIIQKDPKELKEYLTKAFQSYFKSQLEFIKNSKDDSLSKEAQEKLTKSGLEDRVDAYLNSQLPPACVCKKVAKPAQPACPVVQPLPAPVVRDLDAHQKELKQAVPVGPSTYREMRRGVDGMLRQEEEAKKQSADKNGPRSGKDEAK